MKQQNQQCKDDDNYAENICKSRIPGPKLAHVRIVDGYRQDTKSLADERRRSEIRKTRHKDHKCSGKNCREDKGKRDLMEAAPTACTEILRRLLQ